MNEEHKSIFIAVGKRIKKLRKGKKLSQHELATKCEVDRAKISTMENAKEDFMFTTFLEICKGLEVEPRDLLDFKI